MKFWFKQIFITVVALSVMAVCGLAAFILSFDPNSYKNALQVLVQQRTDRQLVIGGDLKVLLFPKIAIQARQVSLSEKSSSDIFASVDDFRAKVAIWPLLTNQLVVEQIDVSGLQVQVQRTAQGRLNFDDLLRWGRPTAPEATAIDTGLTMDDTAIDIASISVKKSEIQYRDHVSHSSWKLDELMLQTGRIKRDESFSVDMSGRIQESGVETSAKINAQAVVSIDLGAREISAKNVSLGLKGDLSAGWWSSRPLQKIDATLKLAYIGIEPEFGRIKLDRLVLRSKALREGTPIEFSLDAPKLEVSDTAASGGGLTARLRIDGPPSMDLKFGLDGLHGTRQALVFDKSMLDMAVKRDVRGDTHVVKLMLTSPLEFKPLATSIALPALEGEVQTLQASASKSLQTFPLKADLYAALDQRAGISLPLVVKAHVENIPFATVLASVGVDSLLDGTASLGIDLKTANASIAEAEKSLTGNIKLHLSKASLRGFNLAAGLNGLKAIASTVVRDEPFEGDLSQRTAFDSVELDMRLSHSLATLTQLNMIAPEWRVTLASSAATPGQINFQTGTLDLLASLQLLSPQTLTTKRFTIQVRQITVPLHLTGSLKRPAVNIQWSVLERDPTGRALREKLLNSGVEQTNPAPTVQGTKKK
jgi:uncharacterized protein involved in outer membrane biogenesis